MKPIKFRFWDIEKNEWFPAASVCHETFNGFMQINRLGCHRVEAMQFIGLKDKNGKEIYEGDIVKWGDCLCVVRWSEFNCGWQLFPTENYGLTFTMRDAQGTVLGEVIGNIYENQELLK